MLLWHTAPGHVLCVQARCTYVAGAEAGGEDTAWLYAVLYGVAQSEAPVAGTGWYVDELDAAVANEPAEETYDELEAYDEWEACDASDAYPEPGA